MNGAKRSAEAVGCQNESVGERSALGGRTRASSAGRSGSENVGLSNANVGENPMPRKPKGSSARFVHGGPKGVVDGQQVNIPVLPFVGPEGRRRLGRMVPLLFQGNKGTRRYSAEVIHAILPGKARTTFNKWVPVPETDTGTRQNSPVTSGEGVPPHKGGRSDQARATCRKVKEVGDLMTGEPTTEAPVNGGRNYNGPKVAKFLVGRNDLGTVSERDSMRTTCTWTERPYEASLFPGIGFGLFLRSLEPSVRYHSGRARILTLCQDLRAGGQSQVDSFYGRRPPQRRRLALECKGRRELDCKNPPVEQGRKSALVIRRCRVEGPAHIDGKVWHLDVGSSPPGAVVCSKGWAVRPLKRYVSWVQNVVRQFGPYPDLSLVREDREGRTSGVPVIVPTVNAGASGSTAETAMGSLPQRGWSERSFENSREGHGETSRVEEPHQSIPNLVVKLYCGDDTVGEAGERKGSHFLGYSGEQISSGDDGVGPVAQRIRARGYEPRCRGFESLLAHNRPKKGRIFPSGGRKIMIGLVDPKLWNLKIDECIKDALATASTSISKNSELNRMGYDQIEYNRNKDKGNELSTLLNGQSKPFHSELQISESIQSPQVGFEPTTSQLTADRSTTELLRNNGKFDLIEFNSRSQPMTNRNSKFPSLVEEGTEKKNSSNNWVYYGTAHNVHVYLLCAFAFSIG
ncbi:hypothetical protein V8G54_037960 (chloroplast) [Vigna mungo]|uniref:Uncharacterized protein n=3 Tax=50 kb inversion clade TaxID=2231393 RepID=A0AAQ3ME84_VIGMU